MSIKLIVEIIVLGFLIQGMFFAVFRADKLVDHEKFNENPNEALKIQGIIFLSNLIFWGAIIYFAERFLK